MKAQHSKAKTDWGTPFDVVELARRVMGDIVCDPCSSEYWNTHTVGARHWFGEADSVLATDQGREFRSYLINPPGGLVKEFFSWALDRWEEGSSVFWVGFSLEQLAYLQREPWRCMRHSFVRAILPRRLPFLTRGFAGPIAKKGPTHSNYLLYIPATPGDVAVKRFQYGLDLLWPGTVAF